MGAVVGRQRSPVLQLDLYTRQNLRAWPARMGLEKRVVGRFLAAVEPFVGQHHEFLADGFAGFRGEVATAGHVADEHGFGLVLFVQIVSVGDEYAVLHDADRRVTPTAVETHVRLNVFGIALGGGLARRK